jgi:glutathione synthase/RimK-type ligase-like ATP-grasp enzyme
MTVLIISSVADTHAQAVMAALARSACAAELLDLADFPLELSLSMEYARDTHRFQLKRRTGEELDLAAVTAVWWRRPQPFCMPPDVTDAAARRFIASESATAFQGLYQSLDAAWINEPSRDSAASHKPYQLTLAQEIGLEIAPTLITNDPVAAREFWRAHPGEVIHKQLIALPETWRETRRLNDEDESLANGIVYAPVQFQRHVPAVADLRVTVVGERLFAAGTDVREGEYPQDVRMNLNTHYAPHDLPGDVTDKILTLMRRLGLVYGALDFRLTPEGRYVFLEINPAGQFLYIENDTGQPIAAALAQELAKAAD